MKLFKKYFLLAALLELAVIAGGYSVFRTPRGGICFTDVLFLSILFVAVTFVTLLIFIRGQGKDPGSQTMHTLVAVTLKFLIELAVTLVWFFLAKKRGLTSVILFFVLYLAFTMFSVYIILKTLKNKSLEQDQD